MFIPQHIFQPPVNLLKITQDIHFGVISYSIAVKQHLTRGPAVSGALFFHVIVLEGIGKALGDAFYFQIILSAFSVRPFQKPAPVLTESKYIESLSVSRQAKEGLDIKAIRHNQD